MADPHRFDIAHLNEFGLPRHGDGVGPTLRPDLIAERHRHDWDLPPNEGAPFVGRTGAEEADSLGTRLLADDLMHRARAQAVGAEGMGLLEEGTEGGLGDNEQHSARLAHAQAQGGDESESIEGG